MRIQLLAHAPAVLVLAGLMLGSTGCGPREAAPPAASATSFPIPTATRSAPSVPTDPVPASPAQVAPGKAVLSPAAPAATAAPPSAEAPAPTPKPPAPAQSASPVSDPGGEVAVKPTKAGLARVGAAACKMCHKLQFASWSETAHATRTPPLDCESCHGPAGEYKSMAVMKDPAKAAAAGLVRPGVAFCATCHKRGWNDGMLKKAHAHKP